MKTFQEFMILENVHQTDELPNYVKNGRVTGYHYLSQNRIDEPKKKVILNPDKIGQNLHSKAELRASPMPRVFFYVDLRDKESYFSMDPLYKAEMDVTFIYSFPSDPLGIVAKIIGEGHSPHKLLYFLKEYGYKGTYYQVPGMRLLNWFYPIEATLTDESAEMSGQREFLKKSKEDSDRTGFKYDLSTHDPSALKTHMDVFDKLNKIGGMTQRDMELASAAREKWDQGEEERLKQREKRREAGLF